MITTDQKIEFLCYNVLAMWAAGFTEMLPSWLLLHSSCSWQFLVTTVTRPLPWSYSVSQPKYSKFKGREGREVFIWKFKILISLTLKTKNIAFWKRLEEKTRLPDKNLTFLSGFPVPRWQWGISRFGRLLPAPIRCPHSTSMTSLGRMSGAPQQHQMSS